MIPLKSPADIDAIAQAGRILARLFEAIEPEVQPGRNTWELDRFGEEFIRAHDAAVPAFKDGNLIDGLVAALRVMSAAIAPK